MSLLNKICYLTSLVGVSFFSFWFFYFWMADAKNTQDPVLKKRYAFEPSKRNSMEKPVESDRKAFLQAMTNAFLNPNVDVEKKIEAIISEFSK